MRFGGIFSTPPRRNSRTYGFVSLTFDIDEQLGSTYDVYMSGERKREVVEDCKFKLLELRGFLDARVSGECSDIKDEHFAFLMDRFESLREAQQGLEDRYFAAVGWPQRYPPIKALNFDWESDSDAKSIDDGRCRPSGTTNLELELSVLQTVLPGDAVELNDDDESIVFTSDEEEDPAPPVLGNDEGDTLTAPVLAQVEGDLSPSPIFALDEEFALQYAIRGGNRFDRTLPLLGIDTAVTEDHIIFGSSDSTLSVVQRVVTVDILPEEIVDARGLLDGNPRPRKKRKIGEI